MKEILKDLEIDDPSFAFLGYYEGFAVPDGPVPNKSEVGRAFYNLAKIYYDKSDLDKAEENFVKALKCSNKSEDHFVILKTLGFLIRIASEGLEDEKAKKYIELAREVAEGLTGVMDNLNSEYFYHLGVLGNYMGNFLDAEKNFLLAYKKSKEENNPELLSKCLLSLATNKYLEGDYKLAMDYVSQLNELLKIIDKSYLQGSMYLLLGKIYVELGEYQKALVSFGNANNILQAKKCWNLYGYVLLGKGTAYKNMGEYDNALLFFELARNIADPQTFKRLYNILRSEIEEVNDSSVDLYLDKTNRKIREKFLGIIDFKHRFILLEILFLLARNPGTSFDKEQLAKAVWKDEYNPLIHDKLIYTSVSRLRKLIEPKNNKDDRRKYILRSKDGYTFNSVVKIRFHMESKVNFSNTIANVDLSSPV